MSIIAKRTLASVLAAGALAACSDSNLPTASPVDAGRVGVQLRQPNATGWSEPVSLGATVNAWGFDSRTGGIRYVHSPYRKGFRDIGFA